MKSDVFGYKTKVLLLAAGCYVMGRIVVAPMSAMYFLVNSFKDSFFTKETKPQPPSSGFNEWLSSQDQSLRDFIGGLFIAPLHTGKKTFMHSLNAAQSEAGFYRATACAFFFAALIRPARPFRVWEFVVAFILWIAGRHKETENEQLIRGSLGAAIADTLISMSSEDRKAVFDAIKRFAVFFKPPANQPVANQQAAPPTEPQKTKSASSSG